MSRLEMYIKWWFFCILLAFQKELLVYGLERIELRCLSDQIQIDIRTLKEFQGSIYTQGSFRQNGCYLDAEKGTQFQISFSLNQCNTVQQKNGYYNNVLIIQHEDELITKDDYAFNILCNYNTREKTVELKFPLVFEGSEDDNKTTEIQSEKHPSASIFLETLHVFGNNQPQSQNKMQINDISSNPNVAVLTVKQLKSHFKRE